MTRTRTSRGFVIIIITVNEVMVKHGHLLFGRNSLYKVDAVDGKNWFCAPTIKP